ncbi:hypothetical protein SASPL_151802 [Salvia splendens]|uniref:Uncharacterized protein n=1 Tax=Salvia splendens TaxID=180675 RepID=A0A8X8W2C5_SALSN|nr:putative UPF0481 protein At3g02645 [Salvia splendens]KAG6386634.1 hypothetical protein SASPL_151802 [Salvia splendens]
MADIAEETPAAVSVDIRPRWRMLHRVPVHVREEKKHVFEPVVVPLGPYHCRQHPQSQLVEPLKDAVQDIVCKLDRTDRKGFLLSKILERIDEIRHFYGGADGYTDQELAEMILRDACFLVFAMLPKTFPMIRHNLGMYGMLFMSRDMYMLENQIPLWLIPLIHPQPSFLCKYLSSNVFGDYRMTQLSWENGGGGEEPLHLLEAFHRTFLSLVQTPENSSEGGSNFWRLINKYKQARPKEESSRRTLWQNLNSPFQSATDLKAKGIHFRRSSHCLGDIKFFSFALYAELHLPFFNITNNSKTFFSNMIAFEMSPETETDYGVTSYFNFMKTLILNASDVKVLREKGILYSRLASDEEVVEMFKSIDTYGYSKHGLLDGVKMRIEEHCSSKAKTWMADLVNTKFRSPWAVIALAAAAFLLALTVVQTYYTVNPAD